MRTVGPGKNRDGEHKKRKGWRRKLDARNLKRDMEPGPQNVALTQILGRLDAHEYPRMPL